MLDGLKPYPEYKDIGQPWVGAVPSHWQSARGKRLFIRMQRPARVEDQTVTCFRDGVVTLRRNRRLRGFTEALKEIGYQGIRAGDLVIHAMDAFAGAVGVSDSDGKGSPVYQVCQPSEGVNAKYYAFLVREMSRSQWIVALAKGIRERSTDFRFETFGAQFLPFPPPAEQAGIVQFLGAVDRKVNRFIRAKRRLIEVLTEQKQAIITHAVTRGLNPDARLKPSGIDWLGEVPEHWEVRKLGQIAKSFRTGPFGSIIHQSDYIEGGTPLINPTHMKNGRIVADTRCSVPVATAERLAHYRLNMNDLIFSRRGELGRCALVRDSDVGYLCGTGSILIRMNYEGIDPEYLIQALQVGWVGEYLSLFSVGATMESLNTGILKGVPILLPPVNEQRELLQSIEDGTRAVDHAIRDALREIDLIREYRTRLVADVVTGKVDVREAAAELPDEIDAIDATADALSPIADDEDSEEFATDDVVAEAEA